MTTRGLRAGTFAIVVLTTAGAPFASEPKAAVSHLPGGPARALTGDDLKITASVPLLDDIEGHMVRRTFDLRERSGLAGLREALVPLDRLADMQDTYRDSHPERILPFRFDVSSSGKRRAIQEMLALADRLLQPGEPAEGREATLRQILELHHAVENSFRYPVKKNYQLVPEIFPVLLIKKGSHKSVDGGGADGVGTGDPAPSSFWSPPGDIGVKDLYAGFGRPSLPTIDGVCEYVEPKTGWGAHPGFEVKCGGRKMEFKLGDEIYGGPFNTRIFDALGYRTFPIDRMDALKLRYDRRVLSEYNSRRYLFIRAKLLFVPLFKHVITKIEDPFARIEFAMMKDGRRVPGTELSRRLLRNVAVVEGRPRPETVAANYDEEVERQIDYLVWEAGTVAHEPEAIHAIGAWDYDQLDHAARREVRALFTLAAWLDEYNMRWENTRLAYVEDGEGATLRHLLSDVGSGLSDAHSMLGSTNSDIEAMRWEVTEKKGDGGVRFSGFAVNVMNDAFDRMTADDARWMVRKLAALSEPQVLQALAATNMSAAEVALALEKLLSKRQKMVADFGLAGELPQVMARRIDRALDFDPGRPEDLRRVTASRPDGTAVTPRAGKWVVRAGHLVAR